MVISYQFGLSLWEITWEPERKICVSNSGLVYRYILKLIDQQLTRYFFNLLKNNILQSRNCSFLYSENYLLSKKYWCCSWSAAPNPSASWIEILAYVVSCNWKHNREADCSGIIHLYFGTSYILLIDIDIRVFGNLHSFFMLFCYRFLWGPQTIPSLPVINFFIF